MQTYQFSACGADGAAVSGRRIAASAEALADTLADSGLRPISIQPARIGPVARLRQAVLGRVTPIGDDSRIMLCRQLASLLTGGVPLDRAVRCIADSTQNRAIRQAMLHVHESVSGGQELALALRQQPGLFTPLAISLVHAGEQIGRLDRAFEQIATQLERERTTRRLVWQALRYPLVVVGALIAALVLINLFAVPAFARVFNRVGMELPLPTRVLMASSDFIIAYGWLLLGAVAALAVILRLATRSGAGRLLWDRGMMRVPVVSTIFQMCIMARFCRSLGMLVRAGVPLLQSIAITADIAGNLYFRQRILYMRDGLARGASLSATARDSGLFTPLVLQMLAVGEESGCVEELMERVGEYYEQEAAYRAERMSAAIQPLLLAGLGVVIALVALGIYMPLWSMMSAYT